MRRRASTAQYLPAFLAALLFVIAGSSHIHLRYCLDGDEAPVSIHIETEYSHPGDLATNGDLADADQADIESELSLDTLLSKFSKPLLDSAEISNFEILAISRKSQNSFQLIGREILPDRLETRLPPSRAPPAIA